MPCARSSAAPGAGDHGARSKGGSRRDDYLRFRRSDYSGGRCRGTRRHRFALSSSSWTRVIEPSTSHFTESKPGATRSTTSQSHQPSSSVQKKEMRSPDRGKGARGTIPKHAV